jgi:hypothetical protein
VSRTIRQSDAVPAGPSARNAAFSAPVGQPNRSAMLQLRTGSHPASAMPSGRPSGSVASGHSSSSQAFRSGTPMQPLAAVSSRMSAQPMPAPRVFSTPAQQPAGTLASARNAVAAPTSQSSSLPAQTSSMSASAPQPSRTPAAATSVPAPRASGASAEPTTTPEPSSQPSSLSARPLAPMPAPAAASPATSTVTGCDARFAASQRGADRAASCRPRNRTRSSGR